MSVQSISNSLTPQEIQQLLQQMQLSNADSDGASATTADPTATNGQNLPTGTNSQDDPTSTTAPVVSGQSTMNPKTVLALLQIQEGQQMEQTDTLLFGGGDTSSLFGGSTSTSTGDPLLDAMDSQQSTSSTGDPLLDAMDSDQSGTSSSTGDPLLDAMDGYSPTSVDDGQSVLNSLNTSSTANSGISDAGQQLLSFLNASLAGSATSTGTAATTGNTGTAPDTTTAAAALASTEEEA